MLGGKTVVVRYQPGDTLLETARRGGLRPPFSCEAGNCATCMAFLKEGSVRMRANNALTPEEVEEGWVLTCQSLPFGRDGDGRVRSDVIDPGPAGVAEPGRHGVQGPGSTRRSR